MHRLAGLVLRRGYTGPGFHQWLCRREPEGGRPDLL